MQIYSRVKCIKADDEGILVDGGIYTIMHITEKGNIKLWELDPPKPYTTFYKHRFEDTGDLLDFMVQEEEWDNYYEGS